MARINIEDKLYKDARFLNLIIKLGNIDTALGAMVRAWSLAQKHYLNESNARCIPLNEWQHQLISDEIINCKLAEYRENGIYVYGSEDQFSWLLQKQSAGKQSAKIKSENKQDDSEHSSTPVERTSTYENGPQPPFSLLSSPSSNLFTPDSNSSSFNISEDAPKKPKRKKTELSEEEKSQNRKIKDAYFNAYRLRYGIDPISNAIFNSQVSSLRKKLGTDEAILVVQFYLTHNDQFYLKNTHSFAFCLSNADTLRTQMLRGKAITSQDVRNFEKTQNVISVNESLKKGENF